MQELPSSILDLFQTFLDHYEKNFRPTLTTILYPPNKMTNTFDSKYNAIMYCNTRLTDYNKKTYSMMNSTDREPSRTTTKFHQENRPKKIKKKKHFAPEGLPQLGSCFGDRKGFSIALFCFSHNQITFFFKTEKSMSGSYTNGGFVTFTLFCNSY